ncbi:hypothetical protein OIU74_001935 [Salix koriyanagi]|uniref:Uncharacterized protein n=1 Tax=Salix koriyanagi TaxID=2511006 RepID=A0A9Q0X358_9ROSI|nr:hypothetical protein OIU74_001935 [Salix koriyanagi]
MPALNISTNVSLDGVDVSAIQSEFTAKLAKIIAGKTESLKAGEVLVPNEDCTGSVMAFSMGEAFVEFKDVHRLCDGIQHLLQLIGGYGKAEEVDRAISLKERMKEEEVEPSVIAFNPLLSGLYLFQIRLPAHCSATFPVLH